MCKHGIAALIVCLALPAFGEPSDRRAGVHREEERKHSDAWLTTEVKLGLFANENVPATSVHVDTRDGKVTLFGTVPNESAKASAETTARKVEGVNEVENALTVVPRAEKKAVRAKDEALKASIRQSFEHREALHHVDVEVRGGVVRLTGTVPSADQRLEAARISRETPGVRSVSSDLQVKQKEIE